MRETSHRGVKRLDQGRYMIRVWYTHPKTGRNARAERIVSAASAGEAARKREELRARLRAGGAKRTRERLGDFAASWLRSKAKSWKRSTLSNAVSILEAHIAPALGDYWIDAIDEHDVRSWRDSLGGSPASVNSRLRLLRQLLGDACHAHGIANPAARVPGVRVALDDERAEYIPDAGEAAALLSWLRGSERYRHWHPLVELLAFTGARFGEATALRWSDVDFEQGVIHVRRAHWHGVVDHPKSRAGRRTVVLPAELAETLRGHQAATGRVGAAYVFLGRRGNLHQTSVLQKPMRAAIAACGLADKRISAVKVWRRIHNNLLRQVTSEAVRQALMGHASAEVGLRHYTQVERAEMEAAAAQVVRLVRGE